MTLILAPTPVLAAASVLITLFPDSVDRRPGEDTAVPVFGVIDIESGNAIQLSHHTHHAMVVIFDSIERKSSTLEAII